VSCREAAAETLSLRETLAARDLAVEINNGQY
jgi:hypothetical protein